MTKKLHGFRAFFLMFFVLLQLFPIDFDDLPSNICDNVNNDPLLRSYLSNSLWLEYPYFVQKLFLPFESAKFRFRYIYQTKILYHLQLNMYFIKGQFISKEPSGAEDSPKKRTNEFVFFYQTAFCVVKRRLSTKSEFVRSFFGRNHKTFWN